MSSTVFFQLGFVAVVTYGMHSTLTLLTAWGIDATRQITSLTLKERLWKSAAIVPLLTTVIQLCWTDTRPAWEWQVAMQTTNETVVDILPSATDAELNAPMASSSLVTPASLRPHVSGSSAFPVDAPTSTMSNGSDGQEPQENRPFFLGTVGPVDAEQIAEGFSAERSSADDSKSPVVAARGRSFASPDQAATTESGWESKRPSARNPVSAGLSVLQREAVVAGAALAMMLGSVVLLCRMLQLNYRLNSATIVTGGRIRELLGDRCVARERRQVPLLLISEYCREPAAVGVFRPAIVLPTGLLSELQTAQVRMILAHELAHIERRDPSWMWIGHVLRYCLSWQPLNFLAVRRWRMLAEFQCDQCAIMGDEAGRVTLARVLAGVAEWKSTGTFGFAASAAGPPLSQRINRLLSDERKPDRWAGVRRRQASHLMVAATVAIVSVFGPRLVRIRPVEAVMPSPEFAAEVTSQKDAEPSVPSANVQSAIETVQMRREFDALVSDLELALGLLSAQEEEEEITQKVAAIHEKVVRLRMELDGIQL